MADEPLALKEADAVEITTVLDNTCDMLLASSATVRRASLGTRLGRTALRAEHGFAAAVKVTGAGTSESLLFDAGLSRDGLMHNLDVLELKPQRDARDRAQPRPRRPHQRAGRDAAAAGRTPDAAAAASRRAASSAR